MADTYTQLYIHVMFAVKGRESLLSKEWRNEVFAYIGGIINNKKQLLIIVNGVGDHIHFLVAIKPTVLLSDLVRDVKANSSRFINEKKWIKGKFEWQEGYSAFSVGHAEAERIVNYIKRQEEHHRIKTFKEEYIQFLVENGISYKPEYVFEKD